MMHSQLLRDRVFGDDAYPIASEQHLVDGEIPSHSHDFIEIAVALGGAGVHRREGERLPLRRGLVVAMRPGQWHAYVSCKLARIANLYLGAELIYSDLAWVLDYPGLARFLLRGGSSTQVIPAHHVDKLDGWLSQLRDGKFPRGTPAGAMALGLGCCALAEIATALSSAQAGDHITPVVRRAVRLLSEQPDHPWQMTELAARCLVSVPHLHRVFAAEMGLPPMTWLARARIERASALLIQSNDPISAVGHAVGWPDPNYFSRRFRSMVHLSPSEYRHRYHVQAE